MEPTLADFEKFHPPQNKILPPQNSFFLDYTKTVLSCRSNMFYPISQLFRYKRRGLYTQPDGTVFFLIFTYLRGRSHWTVFCFKDCSDLSLFEYFFLNRVLKKNNKFLAFSLEFAYIFGCSHLSNKRGAWNKRGGVEKLQNQ